MKCILGFILIAICAFQMISSWPVRSGAGMVFYQPDYYRHRAFVMQYASQPVRAYRRQGQAAGVYASGKKVATGTFLKREFSLIINITQKCELIPLEEEDDDEQEIYEEQEPPRRLPAQSTSIAVASPDGPIESDNDSRESYLPPTESNNIPSRDEEQAVDDEEPEPSPPARSKGKGAKESNGVTYFPINFGGSPGVVAIANSYSTGKGEINCLINVGWMCHD